MESQTAKMAKVELQKHLGRITEMILIPYLQTTDCHPNGGIKTFLLLLPYLQPVIVYLLILKQKGNIYTDINFCLHQYRCINIMLLDLQYVKDITLHLSLIWRAGCALCR